MATVVVSLEVKKAYRKKNEVCYEISSVPARRAEASWVVSRSNTDVKALYDQVSKIIDSKNLLPRPQTKPHSSLFLATLSLVVIPIVAFVAGASASPGKDILLEQVKNEDYVPGIILAVSLLWGGFCWLFLYPLLRLQLEDFTECKESLTSFLLQINKLSASSSKVRDFVTAFLEPPLREDWPARVGPIDLNVHDLPHKGAQTEWWYYNAHLESNDGRPLSLFVCFFRFLKHVDQNSGKKYYSHALTWAVSDVKNKRYISDVILERDSPEIMLKALEEGKLIKDKILKRALREVLEKGNVPLPDRLFSKNPVVSQTKLDIEYETSSVVKDKNGNYILKARHYDLPCSLDLVFKPMKNPVRHGNNGVVQGINGDDMFYYFIPRCEVTGTVSIPKPHKAGGTIKQLESDSFSVSGSGWYDHEFGGKVIGKDSKNKVTTPEQKVRYAWNWVGAQLEDNTEITAAVLINPDNNSIMEVKAIVIESDGSRLQFDETDGVEFQAFNPDSSPGIKSIYSNTEPETQSFSSKPESKVTSTFVEEEVKESDYEIQSSLGKIDEQEDESWWRSVRTFKSYPTCYRLVVPPLELALKVEASFGDQEFMTLIAKPAFWEGRCELSGYKAGEEIAGVGYVERNGFGEETTIKSFFKSVGKTVRTSVQKMYPLEPTFEEGVTLVATEDTKHYMKGVPLKELGKTLIKPVREVADRGGKSWRSYGALACVDCVGGDSRDFVEWIAMPEFLHVGSLIIDDIQDKSDTRRGGPCSHLLFGEPLCINAGTAAYFQCEQLIKAPGLSAEDLNKCYGLYFAALRGGHAGQALDIHGLDYLMDDVIASGNADLLEERSLAIHMLKTAVPAGTLARMGALVGKGTEAQIEAMGLYFESVGVAFQIMDDVLNLRGLYSKDSDKMKKGTALKRLGEDIVEGKVTMPVCKAMAKLQTVEERKNLWDIIKSKPQDQKIVDSVIAQLEDLGAIQACVDQADKIVNQAWSDLDSVIPDSFAKMMLRAFGSFVIERCG